MFSISCPIIQVHISGFGCNEDIDIVVVVNLQIMEFPF